MLNHPWPVTQSTPATKTSHLTAMECILLKSCALKFHLRKATLVKISFSVKSLQCWGHYPINSCWPLQLFIIVATSPFPIWLICWMRYTCQIVQWCKCATKLPVWFSWWDHVYHKYQSPHFLHFSGVNHSEKSFSWEAARGWRKQMYLTFLQK